ncbi:putative membrane protein [Anseongella ginsenosidimutans]|uniref:Putative membrane protein n=2 Tax=Anseongella ginsenosidimutans TaxID=496056 RepID=A0A4R3KP09_9SPHI|nr:putative membrane protein [Anseongella ginsenosidimutans]
MLICTRPYKFFVAFFMTGLLFAGSLPASAQRLVLYTPYTSISVPPGESIDYAVQLINKGGGIGKASLSLSKLPEGWEYDLKSGGWSVEQLSVLPGEKQTLDLTVDVPLKVDKGTYTFNLVAGGQDVLPLTVTVSEQGTFKTEFTSEQPNMEGAADATFTFNTELRNRTAGEQLYALRADAPRGWGVVFKPNYKQATSVNIAPNSTASITVEVNPPDQIKAGTYKIPVKAATSTTSASLDLEVVITGSYELVLSTPSGLLSTEITAGGDEKVELIVRNTGSSALKDIDLSASAPVNWEVAFEPESVAQLEPGKTASVTATINADNKAIAGDYVTTLRANTPEATSEASFRVSVKTSMLWGWVGILIILIALGSVFRLFRKYGRR